MKRTFLFTIIGLSTILSLSSCKYFNLDAISGSTLVWESGSNNFFNQEASTTLEGSKYITLTGEVEKDVRLKLSKMPLRSVTVVETRHQGHPFLGGKVLSDGFKYTEPTKENPAQIAPDGAPSISEDGLDYFGTYRYDGYALCDILSSLKIDKESKEDFWPPVDIYVEVTNDAGDKAVFSWGELFYSANMYSIVIAKRVTRVIPGKTGQLWALPSQTQLVVESDLYSERNIPNPSKITIKSLKGNYIVNRDSTAFDAHPGKVEISVTSSGETALLGTIDKLDSSIPFISYPAIYYGHGMGYKGERTFTGQILKDVIAPYFDDDNIENLREGILSVAAIDGYRASFSYSELFNRNDHREALLRRGFTIYASFDNFADRSIKGLTEIRLIK